MFWVIWNILFFQFEDRLYTSESDVYRRQNLKYKDGPRAERKGGDWCLDPQDRDWHVECHSVAFMINGTHVFDGNILV